MQASPEPLVSSSASDRLAHEQRMQHIMHVLGSPGWEQRLAPLAQHMAEQRLVRSRKMGAPVTRVDVGTLQQAPIQMLRLDAGRCHLEERQQLGRAVEELLEPARGPKGQQRAQQARTVLDRARELRRRSIEIHDAAHGSPIDRERERLLATGVYGSRR